MTDNPGLDGLKKNYTVSEKAKKSTILCTQNFSCLNNGDWCSCSMQNYLNDNFLNIKDMRGNKYCSYLISYGHSSRFCCCPVRCEIYKNHKI